jgi:hypothetical protein
MPTVYFGPSGSARPFTHHEIQFFLRVINDSRSWPKRAEWTQSLNLSDGADWHVVLEKDSYISHWIETQYGLRDTEKGLSVTFMDLKPRLTAFSFENWQRVPGPLQGLYSRNDYRHYVINHELGHVLGYDHPVRPLELTNQAMEAPIMLQHTRGIANFRKNIWPLASEKIKRPTL